MHTFRAATSIWGRVTLTPWAPPEMNSDTHQDRPKLPRAESRDLDTQSWPGSRPPSRLCSFSQPRPQLPAQSPVLGLSALSSQCVLSKWVMDFSHHKHLPAQKWFQRTTPWLMPPNFRWHKGGFPSNARLLPGTVSHSDLTLRALPCSGHLLERIRGAQQMSKGHELSAIQVWPQNIQVWLECL